MREDPRDGCTEEYASQVVDGVQDNGGNDASGFLAAAGKKQSGQERSQNHGERAGDRSSAK